MKTNPIRISVVAILLSVLPVANAQERIISGKVTYANDGGPAAGIMVLVRNPDAKSISGFSSSDENGLFSVSYKSDSDSVIVSVTGFSIRTQEKKVLSGSSSLFFKVEYSEQKIREVKVRADAIEGQGDTVKYYVENLRSAKDRSIADVLKKLPGIDISRNGNILYNGKPINKFYIEGIDMLNGRYGIATNNIQAKDVAAIEVYENHQPIKMLQKWVRSDDAAINLRLKEGAKNVWNMLLELGGGYKPAQWTVETVPMMFGRNFQMISTYKTNNTGEDVSKELTSYSNPQLSQRIMLSITSPNAPPVDENRYLDNETHATSVNAIRKMGEDGTITANVNYVNDYRHFEGNSVTTYYLHEGSELVIPEIVRKTEISDRTNVDLKYELNSSSNYFTDKLSIRGEKNRPHGNVISQDDRIAQKIESSDVQVSNAFDYNKRISKGLRLSIKSDSKWENLPSNLRISPTPYPEIFGILSELPSACQSLHSSGFQMNNALGITRQFETGWSILFQTRLNADVQNMSSALFAMYSTGDKTSPSDSMINDIHLRKFDVIPVAGISYMKHDYYIYLYLPVDFEFVHHDNVITNRDISSDRVMFSPSFNFSWNIMPHLKITGSASYDISQGGLWDAYSGYIMRSYRDICNMDAYITRTRRLSSNAGIYFRDIPRAIFMSADVNYVNSKRNVSYGYEYFGTMQQVTAYDADNEARSLTTNANFSKRIYPMSTTINISGSWNRSWHEYIVQKKPMSSRSDLIAFNLGIESQLAKFLAFTYSGIFYRNLSHVASENLPGINVLRQSAGLDFIAGEKFSFSIGGQQFFNGNVKSGDKNIFFLDSSVSFSTGRFQYILEGRNLLNSRSFDSSIYSEMTNLSYSHSLRPASILFKIRFSLR